MKKMAEDKDLSDKIEVDSAGTSGWHRGELPDSRMRQHGWKRDYKFDSLSRPFTSDDFDHFDIILAMDDRNYRDIINKSPDVESQNKVYRITDFAKLCTYDHIPDPYYSGAAGFELVLDLLEDSMEGLLEEIEKRINIDN